MIVPSRIPPIRSYWKQPASRPAIDFALANSWSNWEAHSWNKPNKNTMYIYDISLEIYIYRHYVYISWYKFVFLVDIRRTSCFWYQVFCAKKTPRLKAGHRGPQHRYSHWYFTNKRPLKKGTSSKNHFCRSYVMLDFGEMGEYIHPFFVEALCWYGDHS